MGKDNRFSAIQFSDKKIAAVEVIHREDSFEVSSIVEREFSEDPSSLFSDSSKLDAHHVKMLTEKISSLRKDGEIKAPNLSVCLDSRWVFIHSFPIDEQLSNAEHADQVDWELSNYISPFDSEHYITATAKLDQLSLEGTAFLLSASVRRVVVGLLRDVASTLRLELAVIDVDHFGAEHALRWNYPEAEHETVALLTIKPSHVDVSILVNGVPRRYHSAEIWDKQNPSNSLAQILSRGCDRSFAPEKIYVCGEHVDFGTPVGSHGEPVSIELLNPVRRVHLSRELRRMELSRLQRLAPAIGIAMRKE